MFYRQTVHSLQLLKLHLTPQLRHQPIKYSARWVITQNSVALTSNDLTVSSKHKNAPHLTRNQGQGQSALKKSHLYYTVYYILYTNYYILLIVPNFGYFFVKCVTVNTVTVTVDGHIQTSGRKMNNYISEHSKSFEPQWHHRCFSTHHKCTVYSSSGAFSCHKLNIKFLTALATTLLLQTSISHWLIIFVLVFFHIQFPQFECFSLLTIYILLLSAVLNSCMCTCSG